MRYMKEIVVWTISVNAFTLALISALDLQLSILNLYVLHPLPKGVLYHEYRIYATANGGMRDLRLSTQQPIKLTHPMMRAVAHRPIERLKLWSYRHIYYIIIYKSMLICKELYLKRLIPIGPHLIRVIPA